MLRICNVILWSKSNGPLFAGVETFGRRRSKTGKRLPWSDPETGAFSTRLSLCRTCFGFWMLLVTRQLTDPAVAKTQSDYAELSSAKTKIQPALKQIGLTLQSPPVGIRGEDHRVWESRQRDGLLECNAVLFEVRPSGSSNPEFPAQGWSVGDLCCSGPSTI